MFNIHVTIIAILVHLPHLVVTVPCVLYDDGIVWREIPTTFEISWRFDSVCLNSLECYGTEGYPDYVQLCPVFIQYGDSLQLRLPTGAHYKLHLAIVFQTVWESCFGLPMVAASDNDTMVFERPLAGSTYILQTTGTDSINYCQLGLRVNLTVQAQDCSPAGAVQYCSSHGSCRVRTYNQSVYSCVCEEGYYMQYCEEYDACSTESCSNGGTCVDVIAGLVAQNFTCDCVEGYAGADCREITAPCEGTNCHNGTCVGVTLEQYRCDCISGYEGDHCTVNIDDCIDNSCVHGVCIDKINSYQCLCTKGYTGQNCSINYDDCLPSPCMYNGTCVDGIDNYTCSCVPGYEGVNCSIDVNECSTSPCINGVCLDLVNEFKCVCPSDGRFYSESNCSLLSPCAHNTCGDYSTCVPALDWASNYSYNCSCNQGYTGENCSINIDECAEVVCHNHGNCTDGVGQFRCLCVDGYEGVYCEDEIDECATSPCFGTATCKDHLNFYVCECPLGMAGVNCAEQATCSDDPCQNGATCNTTDLNEVKCLCADGYRGTYCEVEIDECNTSPCVNGVCRDGLNKYTCFCYNGWKGTNCEVNHNDCAQDPCNNNATCVDGLSEYTCDCLPGYSGDLCERNIDDCANISCVNGRCVDGVNSYVCECIGGYTGTLCELEVDECQPQPCMNEGVCTDLVNAYTCQCTFPYTGPTCELLPCDNVPCLNQGICTNIFTSPGYSCQCPSGYAGSTCDDNIDDCLPTTEGVVPCNGRGVCVDGVNTYVCLCQPGWVGSNCLYPVNDCLESDCRHNSTCVDDVFGYRCECSAGWEGTLCDVEVNECNESPCLNGATCIDLFNSFRCECADGWYGTTCSLEINECEVTNCLNNATCIDLTNDFACNCLPFYTGRLCDTRYDPCSESYNQCVHNSTCVEFSNGTFQCQCMPGYNGRLCEININECMNSPCANGGSCEDGVNTFTCQCMAGYTGDSCERDVDECLPSPCLNNGTCENLINEFKCSCLSGYVGTTCEQDYDECTSTRCLNGGSCLNTIGSYKCFCADGFQGADCTEDVNECLNVTCLNGGSCVDGIASFSCECNDGYVGVLCETDSNDCVGVYCGNGSCVDEVASYRCQCNAGFEGTNCTIDIDECINNPCMNGGSCQDLIDSYRCLCPEGFSGMDCQLDDSICADEVCINGATCVDGRGTAYECVCLDGYEGNHCETNIDDCITDICANGGTCVDGVNNFTCLCADGWTGLNCTIDIDDCKPNPCQQDGLCQERFPPPGFGCLCISGLGGKVCEVNYDDCQGSCLNGGTCTDLLNDFSCECPPWANGTQCENIIAQTTTTVSTVETTLPGDTVTSASTATVSSTEYSTSSLLMHNSTSTSSDATTVSSAATTPSSDTATSSSDITTPSSAITTLSSDTTTLSSGTTTLSSDITTLSSDATTPLSDTTTPSSDTTTPSSDTTTQSSDTTTPSSDITTPSFDTTITSSETTAPSSDTTTPSSDTTTPSSNTTTPSSDITTPSSDTTTLSSDTTTPSSDITTPSSDTTTSSFDTTTLSSVTSAATTTISAESSTTLQDSLCDCVTCLNGGRCIDTISTDDKTTGYECACPIPYTGSRCEQEMVVYYPSLSAKSSLTHSLPMQQSIDLVLALTVSAGGRLLTVTSNSSIPDTALQATITNSSVVVSATCAVSGDMQVQQMFRTPLEGNHLLQLRFDVTWEGRCDLTLSVDNQSIVTSQSVSGVSAALTSLVLGAADVSSSFTGCLYELLIDESEVSIVEDAVSGYNIGSCSISSCAHSLCENGAECLEDGEGWYCDCPANYGGRYCEKRHCDVNPCLHGGSCIVTTDASDYICLCPYGTHGVDCSLSLQLSNPYFSGEVYGYPSYLSYPKIWGISAGSEFRLEFTVSEQTALNNSLLVFTGQQGRDGRGSDYLAIGLHNGHVVFMFDLGSGAASMTSQEGITADSSLHSVTFGHNGTQGYLAVDGQPVVYASSPDPLSRLNSQSSLYVGGIDLESDLIPRDIAFTGQFIGCVYSITYRSLYDTSMAAPGYPSGLVAEGRNVQQCQRRECDVYSCYNGATCQDLGASFRCLCTVGWSGMLCTEQTTSNICDTDMHNCTAGSTCVPRLEQQYQCLCPLGKAGIYCSQDLPISDPLFDSEESHMVLESIDMRIDTYINIEFKPSDVNGLLLYSSQHTTEYSGDFLAISMYDAYLVVSISMGHTNPLVLTSTNQSIVGGWNHVQLRRNRKNVTVILNGESTSATAQGSYTVLDLSGDLYLGGLPDLTRLHPQAVNGEPATYRGCVRSVDINGYNYQLSVQDAVSGVNVKDCDGTQCGHSVCLNGATCTPILDSSNYTCTCTEAFYGQNCQYPVTCRDKCSAGARCVPTADNASYCLCPAGHMGMSCDQEASMSSLSLQGIANSYIIVEEVPTLPPNTSYSLWISIGFATRSDGLLLWYGKTLDSDYIGVGVVCARLKIIWKLGYASANELLVSDVSVSNGLWHWLTVNSTGKDIYVQLDGSDYHSTTPGLSNSLDVYGTLYLGSLGYRQNITEGTGGQFHQPYLGCVSDVHINNSSLSDLNYWTSNVANATCGT